MGLFSFLNRSKATRNNERVRPPLRYHHREVVSPDTAMTVSAYYRGLIYVATQIAKLPLDIKDADNNIIRSNIGRIVALMPNPEMNSFRWRLMMIQIAYNWGNFYCEIERDLLGRPVALWPIDPRSVELYRYPDSGKLAYKVMGGDPSGNGGDVYMSPKDIFHIPNFHTKDGLSGQGLIAYAAEALGTSIESTKFASGIFSNGGVPSGILKVPGLMSDEAFGRLKDSWDKNHTGQKVGGTAILEEGTTYEALTFTPEVLQFLESRKFGIIEIARFIGIPPVKLFDTDTATYNNIEHANLEVATDCLDAWCRNIEMEIDTKLLGSDFNRRSEFDIYSIFRADMTSRADYFQKLMQSASITPNEIRQAEGKAPFKDGDRHFIASNNFTFLDRLDEVIDSQIEKNTKSVDTAKEPTTTKDPNADTNSNDSELNKAVAEYIRKRV
jgi:HK97 family phage portal protein